ncbi:DNA helicase MCM8-like [Trichogramma pretiosum]|uniref:DNA helicase MCM8-like n=1 Tax=Trichogramma pretiosum TaxID=7493 RepID=UPI0006C95677|nr:DNA helicase MCM8-like [Trichogramma pretiosum]
MSDNPRRKNWNPRWKKRKKPDDNQGNTEERTSANSENEEDSQANSDSNADANQPKKRRIAKRDIPWPGWKLYFDESEYKKTSPILPKLRAVELFLKEHPEILMSSNFEVNKDISIDVNLLYESESITEHWPSFKSELKNNPEHVLSCLGLAVNKVKNHEIPRNNRSGQNNENDIAGDNNEENGNNRSNENDQDDANDKSEQEGKDAIIRVKLTNFEPLLPLKNIKVNYYGKFISIRGCVVRVTKSCHMASLLVLLCNKCKIPYTVRQKNGIYTPKKRCDICGAMKFDTDLASPYVETIPMQTIRIQEHFGEDFDDQGRVPRVMDVELFDDLVDSCAPGDDITLTGIIKRNGTDNGKIKNNPVSDLYLEANSLVNNNSKNKNCGGISLEFTQDDYECIRNIHETEDKLGLLVNSLCPGIYGHEIIKMALLLSLFGGTSKQTNLRDNIHILIVGDPGLGKSQMLQSCSRVAPKGIYVSGNSSTSSGLTVTLIREKGQNDFALEPGALVLSDRGCCCIDEFDKMPTQHQALLEAMEQQSVSVAKSGVIWSLPAKTAILAAANPIGGRYERSKTLNNNLNMSQPLLSRFDLLFLLLDQPDKDMDNFLSNHVMLMHTGKEKSLNSQFNGITRPLSGEPSTLKRRLSSFRNSNEVVPMNILRKYIAYARQYVKPKLTQESAVILQKYYLSLRKNMDSAVNITPCNRQLEALIRLTEARAKLDLREETTEEDAQDIVELMQHTVLGMNEGKLDTSFIQTTKTSKNSMKNLYNLIKKDASKKGNHLYPMEELKDIAKKGGISDADIVQAIDRLNNEGILIKKANNLYKFAAY